MLRTVFVHLNVIICFLLVLMPHFLFTLLDPKGNLSHIVARVWARWILFCSGVRVRVQGKENLTKGSPCIFFCNHQSYFDVLALLASLPVQYRWMAKEELFRIPLFGRAMAKGGYISIDRSSPKKALKSLLDAVKQVEEGASIMIFPEGTRSTDGRLQDFKVGGAVLAIKSQVPVVPITIKGTHKVMPKGSLRVRPGRVEILVDRPIETKGLGTKDKHILIKRIRESIENNLK